jgi:uncharacterized membrane protein
MSSERQDKKNQFSATDKKAGFGKLAVILIALVVIAGVAGFVLLGRGKSDGAAVAKGTSDEVRINLADVSDGQAHYFKFDSAQGEIKFFVVKSVDGVMRAAFDACDVCYREKKGYRQEGDMMVCNNCNQQFRTDLVNEVKGGCNPAPLVRRIDGNQLIISNKDIVLGAHYFGG